MLERARKIKPYLKDWLKEYPAYIELYPTYAE